jgi:hypothetical protein
MEISRATREISSMGGLQFDYNTHILLTAYADASNFTTFYDKSGTAYVVPVGFKLVIKAIAIYDKSNVAGTCAKLGHVTAGPYHNAGSATSPNYFTNGWANAVVKEAYGKMEQVVHFEVPAGDRMFMEGLVNSSSMVVVGQLVAV